MDRVDTSRTEEKISSGISCIDAIFSGGLEKGIITEVYGEGGGGKTNLSLIFSLSVLSAGKSVIYLDTEGVSTERIRQLSSSMTGDLKRLYLYRIKSLEDQELTLLRVERNLDRKQMVPDLIVIDSFTEYFRLEKSNDAPGRTSNMQKQMAILMSILSKADCAVLITNQIYQDIQTGALEPFGGYVIDHSVKAIYKVTKLPESKRKVEILKHRSSMEGQSTYFRITGYGLECLPA